MADGWLEPRTRIPFAGIIAIVIIVGIVALFLRSYMVDAFPDNDISIQGAVVSEDTNLRGSATFQGERQFELQYNEQLTGVLSRTSGTLTFVIDVPSRTLTVTGQGQKTQVELSPTDDKSGLASTYEWAGEQVQVAVYPGQRELRYKEDLVLNVALSESASYDGLFLYDGDRYDFSYRPASSSATIGSDEIALEESDGVLVGTWREETSHAVMVDPARQVASIDNVW